MLSLKKITTIKIFWMVITISASALLVFVLTTFFVKKEILDFACSANITHVDEMSKITMNANAYFIFRADGKGIVTLDGEIIDGLKNYNLSRTIIFEYEHFVKDVYLVKEREYSVNTKDTIPSNIFEEYIFSSKYFHISTVDGLKDSLLIASRLTPITICVFN